MPSQSLISPYGVNQGLIMNAKELAETYFFGVVIRDQSGNLMPTETINFYIRAAQQEVEKYLDLKLTKQIVSEDFDFWRDDWNHWGYIPTTYPVNKAFSLVGYLNDIKQVIYPKEWLSVHRVNSGMQRRQVHIVPSSSNAPSTSGNSVIYSGISPHMGFMSNVTIPNYWRLEYCTGFDKIPDELVNVVGRLAAINIFHILGDLILGAGIASQSIGIDGLSQSVSSTSSATNAGYGSRIVGYLNDIKRILPNLKSYYKGFTMLSL